MDLISVLIPAYNHERYVGECVRSVMAQTWPRMELLIVDDGSKDATWNRIRELAETARASGRFERVEVATQTNHGIVYTLNRLCDEARGEVVAIIASDDMYLPGAFANLMAPLLADPTIGVVVGQNEIMDGDGRRCFWDAQRNAVYDLEAAKWKTFNEAIEADAQIDQFSEDFGTYETLVNGNSVPNGYLIRRDALKRVLPYTSQAPLEDWWLHLQLSKIVRYKSIPEHTFRYRWHSTNTIKQRDRMLKYSYQTWHYEETQIRQLADPRWSRIFEAQKYHRERLWGLGNLIYKEWVGWKSGSGVVWHIFGLRFVSKWRERETF